MSIFTRNNEVDTLKHYILNTSSLLAFVLNRGQSGFTNRCFVFISISHAVPTLLELGLYMKWSLIHCLISKTLYYKSGEDFGCIVKPIHGGGTHAGRCEAK